MIIVNRKLWADGYDLSGYLSAVALEAGLESQDDTVFGDGARSSTPGLETVELQEEGLWSSAVGAPDRVIAAEKGLVDVLATVGPVDGDVGSVAYFFRTTQGVYSPGGAVGELLRFSASLGATGGAGLIRGFIGANANLASSTDGTALNLGAVGSGQSLYAGLHVLSADGSSPTLDVIIESDTEEAFGDSPSTRITFSEASAIGSEWVTPVAGPITDTWWRASWTIGGTSSPNFDAVIVIGIQ